MHSEVQRFNNTNAHQKQKEVECMDKNRENSEHIQTVPIFLRDPFSIIKADILQNLASILTFNRCLNQSIFI